MRFLALCILLILSPSLSAQQHKERWKADDYFPAGHFAHDNDDHWEVKAGEVAYYMRLADIPSWKDSLAPKGTVRVRVSMLPEYSNPLFVIVEIGEQGGTLQMCRGEAVCGHVEHSTYYEMSDTGYYDATETHYHGNVWVKGVFDQKRKNLEAAEIEQLKSALLDADMPKRHHITCWGGFKPPYVIEYIDNKHYNAVYDECYNGTLGQLVNTVVALADSSCIDMVVWHPNNRNGIKAAQFPGGKKACKDFIASNLHYPELALFDGEETEIHLDLIIERDGSVKCKNCDKDDKYGFYEEARRILALMPRWQPTVKDGKVVRGGTSCQFQFKLPAHLQPKYGTPTLETNRDSNKWDNILALYRKSLRHPNDQQCLYLLGIQYYDEFLLPGKPIKEPNWLDSSLYKNSWDAFFDRTPVIKGAADSALHYFYRVLDATDSIDTENYINIYLPILQLEQYLNLPHNPANQLPYDSVSEMHYPASYFVNMDKFKSFDTVTDYSMVLFDSYFWTNVMSYKLNDIGEPVLYNRTVGKNDTLLRFAFYPSFHPSLFFRVEKTDETITLYWTKLDYIVDENTLETTYQPKQGHKQLTEKQHLKLMSLFSGLNFDQKPRMRHLPMLDGAQWCIERRTADDFKAHFTNRAGDEYKVIYDYLIKLSGIKEDYVSGYYH